MWFVKLLYLALVAELSVFSVLYIDSLALVMLICALVVPVFMKLCLLWVKLTCEASLNCTAVSCTVHESVPVSVMVENRCPLFFPKVYAQLSVCHAFSDTPEKTKFRFPLHSRNSARLTFYIRPECCGAVKVRIEYLHVLDYFHLFHTKMKKINDEIEILVLPEKLDLSVSETSGTVYAPESSRYASDRPGDDPSEIFNIREYHPGDAVSRIHWKLSSKSDILFIKEFGFPTAKQVLVLAEYLSGTVSGEMEKMQEAQEFLTLIYSLAVQLAEADLTAILAWHSGSRLFIRTLKSRDDLPEIFRELYHALDNMALDAQDLREIFSGQQYSSVTLITNDAQAAMLPVLERQTEAEQKNLVILHEQPLSFSSDSVSVRTVLPEQPAESLAGLVI